MIILWIYAFICDKVTEIYTYTYLQEPYLIKCQHNIAPSHCLNRCCIIMCSSP